MEKKIKKERTENGNYKEPKVKLNQIESRLYTFHVRLPVNGFSIVRFFIEFFALYSSNSVCIMIGDFGSGRRFIPSITIL